MASSMFDDIVLKARDLCESATKISGEIYEVSKYKYECIKLNGEIKKLYEQLGSSVYTMFKKKYDNEELIESLTEEIDEHLDRLREINAILSSLQKVEVCSVCGAKNETANRYCAKCGSRLKDDDCCCGGGCSCGGGESSECGDDCSCDSECGCDGECCESASDSEKTAETSSPISYEDDKKEEDLPEEK